jgi:zinc transport system substrate-binding protein
MSGRTLPLLLLAALGLPGCAGGAAASGASSPRVQVVTSFYPLAYIAARVGGAAVDVRDLTKPGAEPHDLELAPRDVAAVEDADLVLYLSGFQPSVDQAVKLASAPALDVTAAAELDLTSDPVDGSGGERPDPHFWLDPTRLSAVAGALARRLERLDPANRAAFARNLGVLDADLASLDREFSSGLASCANTLLVTAHSAFGYLARRYGLHQRGITGLTPEDEPRARQLAAVADLVRTQHVRTIYYETLVSPSVARTLARETHTRTAVLDPLEAIDTAKPGTDYLSVMRADLSTLRAGQSCR